MTRRQGRHRARPRSSPSLQQRSTWEKCDYCKRDTVGAQLLPAPRRMPVSDTLPCAGTHLNASCSSCGCRWSVSRLCTEHTAASIARASFLRPGSPARQAPGWVVQRIELLAGAVRRSPPQPSSHAQTAQNYSSASPLPGPCSRPPGSRPPSSRQPVLTQVSGDVLLQSAAHGAICQQTLQLAGWVSAGSVVAHEPRLHHKQVRAREAWKHTTTHECSRTCD